MLGGTLGIGNGLKETNMRTSWKAGKFVKKWEKKDGIPLVMSVQINPMPGTLATPRLGPRLVSQSIETLLCISNLYFFVTP